MWGIGNVSPKQIILDACHCSANQLRECFWGRTQVRSVASRTSFEGAQTTESVVLHRPIQFRPRASNGQREGKSADRRHAACSISSRSILSCALGRSTRLTALGQVQAQNHRRIQRVKLCNPSLRDMRLTHRAALLRNRQQPEHARAWVPACIPLPRDTRSISTPSAPLPLSSFWIRTKTRIARGSAKMRSAIRSASVSSRFRPFGSKFCAQSPK